MSDNQLYYRCLANYQDIGNNLSSVGTSVGMAPQSCLNFTGSYHSDTKTFEFTWEDVGCEFWGGVRLVIKNGSEPETFTDGDIIIDTYEKDKYKETPLSVPIENGSGDYYCTLFPFSSTYVMNITRFNTIKLMVLKPFAESTWEEIAAISESGNAASAYSVGDSKELIFDGNTYTMRILGFNLFKLSKDSESTAGICLISDEIIPNMVMDYTDDVLTTDTLDISLPIASNVIINMLSEDVTPYIKEVYSSWNSVNTDICHVMSKLSVATPTMLTDAGYSTAISRIKYPCGKTEADRYTINDTIARVNNSYYMSIIDKTGNVKKPTATSSNSCSSAKSSNFAICFNI